MVTVLLCGSEKEAGMINILLAAIHAVNASALHITAKTVSLLPPDAKQTQLVILDNTNIHDLHMDKGIVLFKSDVNGCTDLNISANITAIVESKNEKAIEIIKNNALQTITCGLSQKDTVTFSSLNTEHAVISLQREIKTVFGNSVLPHEIPLELNSPCDSFQLLAVITLLLLSEIPIPEGSLKL